MSGTGEPIQTEQGVGIPPWADVAFPESGQVPHDDLPHFERESIPKVADWRLSDKVPMHAVSPQRVALMVLAGVLFVSFILFAIVGITTGVFGFLLAALMALVGTFLLPPCLDNFPRIKPSKADKLLISELEDGDELVEVSIYQEGILTGRDRGIAWTEDGGLAFDGHQCSFLIGGQDIDEPYRKSAPQDNEHVIWLRHPKRSVSLRIRILDQTGRAPSQSLTFREHLVDWQQGRSLTRLERMYPPLALHAGLKLKAPVPWSRILICTGLLAFVCMLMVEGRGFMFFWLPFSAIAGLGGKREAHRLEAQLRSEGRLPEQSLPS